MTYRRKIKMLRKFFDYNFQKFLFKLYCSLKHNIFFIINYGLNTYIHSYSWLLQIFLICLHIYTLNKKINSTANNYNILLTALIKGQFCFITTMKERWGYFNELHDYYFHVCLNISYLLRLLNKDITNHTHYLLSRHSL